MVKHDNFKTCSQSGFCKRNRAYADTVSNSGPSWNSPYQLVPESIKLENSQLRGVIVKTTEVPENVRLPLTVFFLESGVARVTVDEEKRINGDIELRHKSKARKQRYDETSKWALVGGLEPSSSVQLSEDTEAGTTKVLYGPDSKFQAIVRHSPFMVDFVKDNATHIQLNHKGYMNVEHWRPKSDSPQEGVDESTWWEESFGGNTDSKPRGPESIGLDITFSGYNHVFGIPEHADSLSLKETR